MSAHTGLPASLRFWSYGVIRVLPSRPYRATQCGRVMPRASPGLRGARAQVSASLAPSERVFPVCFSSTVWPETGAGALPGDSDSGPLNTPGRCPVCPQGVIRARAGPSIAGNF